MRAWTLAEAISKGTGVERPFLCPEHGDSRPSAYVNMIKKKWYCFTCGAKGVLSGPALEMEPDYLVMRDDLLAKLEAENRTYPEAWLNQYDAGPVHPYWLNRFNEQTARRYRLGYDPDSDAVTYPLRNVEGAVLGVVRRPLGEHDGPKYLYPRGVDISRLLFGYRSGHRRTVFLVEGALDAVALSSLGVEAWALYGSRLSSAQMALINRADPTHVVTAFDADDAGYAAHRLVEASFPTRLVTRLTWPASWGKDIDDIGHEHRLQVVSGLPQGVVSVESQPCESSPAGTENGPKSSSFSTPSEPTSRLRIV